VEAPGRGKSRGSAGGTCSRLDCCKAPRNHTHTLLAPRIAAKAAMLARPPLCHCVPSRPSEQLLFPSAQQRKQVQTDLRSRWLPLTQRPGLFQPCISQKLRSVAQGTAGPTNLHNSGGRSQGELPPAPPRPKFTAFVQYCLDPECSVQHTLGLLGLFTMSMGQVCARSWREVGRGPGWHPRLSVQLRGLGESARGETWKGHSPPTTGLSCTALGPGAWECQVSKGMKEGNRTQHPHPNCDLSHALPPTIILISSHCASVKARLGLELPKFSPTVPRNLGLLSCQAL
jgi:hypothetical protein